MNQIYPIYMVGRANPMGPTQIDSFTHGSTKERKTRMQWQPSMCGACAYEELSKCYYYYYLKSLLVLLLIIF